MNTKKSMLVLTSIGLTLIASGVIAHRDVPPTHWAYEAVERIKALGIMSGYPDGTFRGEKTVSRFELASSLDISYRRLEQTDETLSDQLSEIRGAMTAGGDVTAQVNSIREVTRDNSKRIESIVADSENQRRESQQLQDSLKELDEMLTSIIPEEERASLSLEYPGDNSKDVGKTIAKLGKMARWFDRRLTNLETKNKVARAPFPQD